MKVRISGTKFNQVDFGESEFRCEDISVHNSIMRVKIWGIILFPESSHKTYKYLAGFANAVFNEILYAMVAGYDHKKERHYIKQEWGDVAIGNVLKRCVLENALKYDIPDGMNLYVLGDVIYHDKETNIDGGLLYVWCRPRLH